MTGTPPSSRLAALLQLGGLAALAVVAVALTGLQREVRDLATKAAAAEQALQEVHGEVTRMRLEQSAGALGPQGLLAKLRHYAPILVSARTTQPDYDAALKEMQAVLRAFATVGQDAWQPIQKRLAELKADANYDELKWLLEAAIRVDEPAGKQLVTEVLLGTRLPNPRLRWHAAEVLLRTDQPLAQRLLRQVLETESARGADPARMMALGASIPDAAAFASTGFNNFVQLYLRSADPKTNDTLLMVLGRTEHDRITVQECIEALGQRGEARAIERIQRFFTSAPPHFQDPLFQTKCLDALVAIQGEEARPWLEAQLPNATTEKVQKHLQSLLGKPLAKASAAKG